MVWVGQRSYGVAEPIAFRQDAFVWKVNGGQVVLTREENFWRVIFSAEGMLYGPQQVLYSKKHDEAVMAAWDVMGRVKRVASEEEGLQAGQSAARWLRQHGDFRSHAR